MLVHVKLQEMDDYMTKNFTTQAPPNWPWSSINTWTISLPKICPKLTFPLVVALPALQCVEVTFGYVIDGTMSGNTPWCRYRDTDADISQNRCLHSAMQ